MSAIGDYVRLHTERGECKCGKCIDRGDKPDPDGHTADVVFFKVASVNSPDSDEFIRLSREHKGEFCEVDVFDGNEHGYMELGGWIGDQGLAMQYMALGSLLGVFDLLTPRMLTGLPEDLVMQMASGGMLTVKSKAA